MAETVSISRVSSLSQLVPEIVLDEAQSYKVHQHDPLSLWVDESARAFTRRAISKQLSPNALTLLGLAMHLVILTWLVLFECPIWGSDPCFLQPASKDGDVDQAPRCVPRSSFYLAWSLVSILCYILDVMDGEHARHTNTQCQARHFFDHTIDVFMVGTSSIMLSLLAPTRPPLGAIVLISMMSFYTTFLRYYATGVMRIPWVIHATDYVNVVFLGGTSIALGGQIWTQGGELTLAYHLLSSGCWLMFCCYALEDLTVTFCRSAQIAHRLQRPAWWGSAKILRLLSPLLLVASTASWWMHTQPGRLNEVWFGLLLTAANTAITDQIMAAQLAKSLKVHLLVPEVLVFVVVVILDGNLHLLQTGQPLELCVPLDLLRCFLHPFALLVSFTLLVDSNRCLLRALISCNPFTSFTLLCVPPCPPPTLWDAGEDPTLIRQVSFGPQRVRQGSSVDATATGSLLQRGSLVRGSLVPGSLGQQDDAMEYPPRRVTLAAPALPQIVEPEHPEASLDRLMPQAPVPVSKSEPNVNYGRSRATSMLELYYAGFDDALPTSRGTSVSGSHAITNLPPHIRKML